MGKQAAGLRSQQDRRRERARIGTLQDNVVSRPTLRRYQHLFDSLRTFASDHGFDVQTLPQLDEALCSYNYTYAAVRHFLATLAPPLNGAKRLLHAWDKAELPARALPFTPMLLLGVAGAMDLLGHRRAGLLSILMFHCLLRTSEGLTLQCKHLAVAADGRSGAVVLPSTKTRVRNKVCEAVTIDCPRVAAIAQELLHGRSPGDPISDMPMYKYRELFHKALAIFGLDSKGYTPYSLRRGGATWDFRHHGQMERSLIRGRWSSTRSARLYITDGVAQLAQLQLRPDQTSLLQAAAARLRV